MMTKKTRTPWWDRLNGRLIPYIGPPQLGPYDQEPEVHVKPCPICGQPMAGHTYERVAGKPTYVTCPRLS
jgi:hypothetical protein